MTALAGDDDEPRHPSCSIRTSALSLYITNGDTNDDLYARTKTISYTPGAARGSATGSGFIFQDVEADVQAEFERHLPFALDLARSARTTSDPARTATSATRPRTSPNTYSTCSFGIPQPVQVNARRDLGRITLKYHINGGRVRTRSTNEWDGGLRYGEEGDSGITASAAWSEGPTQGDSVKVWFVSRKTASSSEPFTYEVRSPTRVTACWLLAAEDYSGASRRRPTPTPPGRTTSSYYLDALEANGVEFDVWDYDAEGARRPIRSGCSATTTASSGTRATTPSPASRCRARRRRPDSHWTIDLESATSSTRAAEWLLHRLNARRPVRPRSSTRRSASRGRVRLRPPDPTGTAAMPALPSTIFAQSTWASYLRSDWFGGLTRRSPTTASPGDRPACSPLNGMDATLNGPAASAGNRLCRRQSRLGLAFVATVGILIPPSLSAVRQRAGRRIGCRDSQAGRLLRIPGTWYVYSQNIADVTYKRLTRTIAGARRRRTT